MFKPKSLRLEPAVYDQLSAFLRPKESYSACLARLLKVVNAVSALQSALDSSPTASRLEALERLLARREQQ